MDALLSVLFVDIDALTIPYDLDEMSNLMTRFKTDLDAAYAYPFQHYRVARDSIRSRYGTGVALYYANRCIRMSREQMKDARSNAAARVAERNSRQTVISYSFVASRVDWLKSNGLLVDRIFLLMLASGSRRCEIMGTGRSFFTARGPQLIHQLGLAKKTDSCHVHGVTKPLLFLTSEEFLAVLADVRHETVDVPLDSNGLLSIFDRRLEALSRICWPQFVSNGYPIGTHVCRALYVSIAYQLHQTAKESVSAFASRVLGHEGFGLVPNYLHAHVTFDASGPRFDEATRQYETCVDKLVPVVLLDDDGNDHSVLPLPHRRLTSAERAELNYNRTKDLEDRKIPLLTSSLRQLGIL